MRKRQIIHIFSAASLAGVVLLSLLSAPIKQVRVITDRATIYSEPTRSSARIDVVEKGAVLTLFQQNKVRDVWYYVSFQSPRYGARISGFIHESAVEPVIEKPIPSPTEKIAEPEKIEPPPEKALALPPKVAPPRTEETLIASLLPKSKAIKLPRQMPQPKDVVWKVAAPILVTEPPKKEEVQVEEIKPMIPIETLAATFLPRSRPFKLPAKEKAREDKAWKIVQLVIEEKKVEPPPPPPSARKEEPKEKPPAVAPVKTPRDAPAPVRLPRREPSRGERGLLTIGLGYGPSLGGAGVSLQLNTKAGFALHGGLGYYPTTLIYSETDWVKNKILYSAGVKYYLPFKSALLSPYVDLQYGGLRVEAAQIVLGVWEYTYVLGHEQKTLWGPSALAGAEFRKGRFGINGAAGISYALTEWEYLKQKISFSFDFSFLVYF